MYSTNKLSVVLFASVDNKYHDVNIDGYQFKMNITDCDESQFKKFDKNNKYFYCENPKCSDECPVALEKAICVKGNKNTINSNSCTCLPGWIGENCQNMDFEKIKYNLFFFYTLKYKIYKILF